MIGGELRAHVLHVQPLGLRRRADEVDEDDRDDFALLAATAWSERRATRRTESRLFGLSCPQCEHTTIRASVRRNPLEKPKPLPYAGGAATLLDGHRSSITHTSQRGLRASHTRRPCQISEMREAVPIGARDDLDEVALDLDRILLPGQPEPLREPAHVRVDDDALRVAELGRDDVRRLARDAGQPQ